MPNVAALEREDIVMFINAACACTGQTEFYGNSVEQRLSLQFLHEYVFGNYRTLYGLCMFAGINHYNRAIIIERLLRSGAPPEPLRTAENLRIQQNLASLPPQRVYRMFSRLRVARVNNRRTRATIRGWLNTRDLWFDALKYRGLLRSAARHIHLSLPDELRAFLFDGPHSRGSWSHPQLDAFRRAKYEKRAIYELPFTVAEGLAAAHKIPRARFLKKIQPMMTKRERERTFRQREAPSDIRLHRMPLTAACSLYLSLPTAERTGAMLTDLRTNAAGFAGSLPARIRGVFDNSYSSRGGAQKRNRPLAVALGISLIFEHAVDFKAYWTSGSDPARLQARGQTDLVSGLLRALSESPDLIVVVSDGFENDPPGATAEVLRLFRTHIDPNHSVRIVHLNPVFDASAFMPRPLGDTVATVGIRVAEDLMLKLPFARFTHGDTTLDELSAWLRTRSQA